jgi:hypothetical protein
MLKNIVPPTSPRRGKAQPKGHSLLTGADRIGNFEAPAEEYSRFMAVFSSFCVYNICRMDD